MLHPTRPQQPRERTGQFAAGRSISFDGGVRTPAPYRQDPVREHDALISNLAQISRTYGGSLRF
jgi:hypothetical protein